MAGCDEEAGEIGKLERVWGRVGISEGRFQKPRAIAVDENDEVYVVDMTARIQVFDHEGNYLRDWHTPESKLGRPTGLSMDRQGRLVVADSHYHRLLIYSRQGELLQTIGGKAGAGPGEFDLIGDIVQDSEGNYFVSEYGENDRIQKISPEGKFLAQWGVPGSEPGQLSRPQCLALDEEEDLWVADSCNHRIQVFNHDGKLLRFWGSQGSGPGELYYPYSLVLGPNQTVYVVEYGNHRVQKFTREGKSLGWWGAHGREPGQLFNPWAAALDSQGRLHVLDSSNHRVQTVKM